MSFSDDWRWEDRPLEFAVAAEKAGTLGMEFGETEDGVTIKLLSTTAGAYTAGLKVSDIVRSVNGIRPYSGEHAREIMQRRSIFGDVHKLRVVRPGLKRVMRMPMLVLCLLVLAALAYSYGPSLGGSHELLEL